MRSLKKAAWGLMRLGIGFGIVAFLLISINNSSSLIEFAVPACDVSVDAVYRDAGGAIDGPLMVVDSVTAETTLRVVGKVSRKVTIPATGTLLRVDGEGPDSVSWTEAHQSAYGLRLMGEAFRGAWENRLFLFCAAGLFFGCLCLCTTRWKLILDAHDIHLSWRATLALFMTGQFFNAFMLGATGGDVIKAYYVARKTSHRKTEAVTTVVIDRTVGLVALILLALVVMLFRIRYVLSDPRMLYGLAFVGILAAGIVGGSTAMLLAQRYRNRWNWLRAVLNTRIGSVFERVFESFYLSLTHPVLLLKVLPLSILNHCLFIMLMFSLAKALELGLSLTDVFTVGPIIAVIGAVPITPGGLGLREFAAVTYLGVVGVSATSAMPLSLLLYATMLLWSMVGGVVFLLGSASDKAALKDARADDCG